MEHLPPLVIPKVGRAIGSKAKRRSRKTEIMTINGIPGKNCSCQEHRDNPMYGKWVPLTNYYVYNCQNKHGETVLRYEHRCKECHNMVRNRNLDDRWYYRHLYDTIRTAKRRRIKCVSIVKLDEIVRDCWEKQQGRDYYTDEPMRLGRDSVGRNSNIFSIDRIDNSKGYSRDNIVLCATGTNKIKGSIENFRKIYSKEVLLKIIDYVYLFERK